ncbi:hypothetical protein MHYP_G00315670 [Metynnis hypsauchen]
MSYVRAAPVTPTAEKSRPLSVLTPPAQRRRSRLHLLRGCRAAVAGAPGEGEFIHGKNGHAVQQRFPRCSAPGMDGMRTLFQSKLLAEGDISRTRADWVVFRVAALKCRPSGGRRGSCGLELRRSGAELSRFLSERLGEAHTLFHSTGSLRS